MSKPQQLRTARHATGIDTAAQGSGERLFRREQQQFSPWTKDARQLLQTCAHILEVFQDPAADDSVKTLRSIWQLADIRDLERRRALDFAALVAAKRPPCFSSVDIPEDMEGYNKMGGT